MVFAATIKRIYPFLGATKHLYNWLYPSVGWLVGWSVTHSFDDRHVAPIGLLGLVFSYCFSATVIRHLGDGGLRRLNMETRFCVNARSLKETMMCEKWTLPLVLYVIQPFPFPLKPLHDHSSCNGNCGREK